VVGLLITLPVVAIFYLGDALLGLPFVPFDVLDWMARNLPGGVITFGIDTMVKIITTFGLGETSSAAKNGEHVMAITGLIVTGVVASAVFFFVMNRANRKDRLPGLILGLVVGIPVMLISNAVNFTSTVDPALRALWILVVFASWGTIISWIYNDLDAIKAKPVPDGRVSTQGIDRRSFLLRVGGATATITVVGAGLGALLGSSGQPESSESALLPSGEPDLSQFGVKPDELPNAGDPVEPAPGTRPEYTPIEDHYRIDISSRPPVINGETYTLPITGLVNNPLKLTLDDIRSNYEPMDQFVTLACISNWLGGDLTSTTTWTGASFQKILEDLDLQDNAAYLRIYSADGFDETVDINEIKADERIMLAYDWDRKPLTQEHGFPLRIYLPDRYGMKQPKWIINIEVVEEYTEGYWVRRGWDEKAQMRTTSVVDTIASDAILRKDGQFLVPIGGIAHAGAREISKVEVRVDEGEWVEAQLREPISSTTWRIWRYDWPFEEGRHTFWVRAYDGTGTLQIEDFMDARPSGATGVHSRSATL
jgi:DMSO/TMAO reductase YedYZ molybdopterin-dependent catalytic subunit